MRSPVAETDPLEAPTVGKRFLRRLLYVGSLREGGNGQDRIAALTNRGFLVDGFDTFPFGFRGTRIERSLAARFHIGRAVARLNSDLLERSRLKDYDILLVDKGTWIFPETLAALANSVVAIHYTPDAQFLENRSRHFFNGIRHYDLAVTTKSFEVEHYRRAGAREVLLIHQGYGKRLAPQPVAEIPAALRSEICFIGHCQPHYAGRLERLSRNGGLAIWGPTWDRYARRHTWARACVRGTGLWGPDYARALSGTKIAIGLLSKRIPETTTTRSFEIPACRTFMLAERTKPHLELFEEGREAEFFSSDEELCDKAAFYLKNDAARERIAAAGYERSLKSGYSFEQQFARIADWVGQRLAA